MNRNFVFFAITLLLFPLTAFAQKGYVGSLGEATPLGVLQKMQGRWMSTCVPVQKPRANSYKIDHLHVTLTHLKFKSVIYKDKHCKLEYSRVPVSYRFGIGGPLQLKTGELVFAMNIKEDSDPANIWDLWENNIVLIEKGYLYFGIQPWVKENTERRLGTLDRQYYFQRH